ncbi:ferritin, middle subunit-like [Physella acuta]|uniref:ferritin, middle subunit-like n=1 Tax=Physella acuta TaxID=109671 RepID=UPI0027DDE50A|nr:ferritin, middle subunit-like [Physella acuta]XP_059162102.1 ferritin, middle subunit-like [Physella acuta]
MFLNEVFTLVVLMVTITPTYYSKVDNPNAKRCESKIAECGELTPPTAQYGRMDCQFNLKSCAYSCVLKCNRRPDGKLLPISNKKHAKEMYACTNGVWKRKESPRAFCMANLQVKEVKQNLFHDEDISVLIQRLFNTSYYYLAMASFYERADVALPGFSKFMTNLWQTELDQARQFLSYVNKRGGFIALYDIPRPSSYDMLLLRLESKPGLAGMEAALTALRDVNSQALDLQKQAIAVRKFADPHLKSFVEDHILTQKVEAIKRVADIITRLQSFSGEDYSLGEYTLDLELQG